MKQPLAIWITDLHLTPDTISTVSETCRQVGELCAQQQIPAVILGGDIFTSRQAQPQSVLTAFADILDFLIDVCELKVICIPGNHDKQSYVSSESFLDPYNGRDGFTLFKEYASLTVAEYNLKFHFIPYFDEKLKYGQYLSQAIANISLDKLNLLFTHIAISGVKNNDGSKVSNEFTTDSFQHFHKVLVGHYHNRQIIGNIVYTGSCYQGNHGEDEHKGCTVIYSDGSLEFVRLEFVPYNTWKMDQSQLMQIDINKPFVGNNRVKLNFKPNIEQAAKIAQLEALGIKVECEYEVTTNLGSEDVKGEFDTKDILSYFEQWCDEEKIEDKQIGLQLLQ